MGENANYSVIEKITLNIFVKNKRNSKIIFQMYD